MNKTKLKALVLADWYQMKAVYIIMVLGTVLGAASVFMIALHSGTVAMIFSIMAGAVMSLVISTVFATDGLKGTGVFRKSLPYTAGETVMARYITMAAAWLMTIVLNTLCAVIGAAMYGGFAGDFSGALGFSLVVFTVYFMLIPAAVYPAFYKFGYQKVQFIYSIISSISIVGGMMVGALTFADEAVTKSGVKWSPKDLLCIPMPMALCIIAVIGVIFCLSYRASVKIYGTSDAR